MKPRNRNEAYLKKAAKDTETMLVNTDRERRQTKKIIKKKMSKQSRRIDKEIMKEI